MELPHLVRPEAATPSHSHECLTTLSLPSRTPTVHLLPLSKTASSTTIRLDYVFSGLSMLGTLCILVWVLGYTQYGLDLTDESFYLIWISNPFIYDASVTQFGFIYHPLYRLLGGDLVALRQTNILITFLLSWALIDLVLKKVLQDLATALPFRLIMSAGFATASMTAFSLWLTTPSYNSLNLQALLIAAIGLLHARRTPSATSTLGWVLIGVGGWLSFMAKPSSAAALAACALLYLALTRKLGLRLLTLALPVTLAMLVFSALLIDGSLTGFVQRIRDALELGSHLDSGHSLLEMFRLGDFSLTGWERVLLLTTPLCVFLSTYLLSASRSSWQIVGVTLTVIPFMVVLAVTSDQFQLHWGLGYFQNLLMWAVLFSATAFYAIHVLPSAARADGYHEPLTAMALLSMPYIYAFGSNGNYWWVGGFAGIFWLAGALILIGPLVRKKNSALVLAPTLLVVQAITAVLVQSGVEQPYRQTQPLRTNTFSIEVGQAGSNVLLAEPNGRFLTDAMTLARNAGFEAGTPMIDMTGRSPGILYLLKAENIGQAWTMGGYPGSLNLAIAALRRVPCEKVATAWLLQEEKGLGRIPPDLISHFGGSVKDDYQEAARWTTSRGAGGHRSQVQTLLKPTRTREQATEACAHTRQTGETR